MTSTITIPVQKARSHRLNAWFILLMAGSGFVLRLRLAWLTFLNPDEALHYFLSRQPSLKLAYEASLTTAHPPLMILVLHSWSRVGSSELFLRLPFVISGMLFCWGMFLWVEKIAGRNAAWFAFALFLFAPSLISLAAEIRQYSFLLFFCAFCLYSLERGLTENSAKWMALSAVALYLALLTHYSSLVFAAAVTSYALVRLVRRKMWDTVMVVWIAGQIGAAAICVFLYYSQISRLRQSGLPSEIAATWLSSSIFHGGQDHLTAFAWTKTLRLFRYFFSHGTIGLFGLILFLYGIVVSLWPNKAKLRNTELALFLLLPFLITLGAAVAGIYPYGGTRHDVVLAIFAIPGIAIGLDGLLTGRLSSQRWFKPLLLGAALAICNLAPSPSGPHIRPQYQSRELMAQAMSFLRSLPPDSVVLADAQGSMVLNYYLCGEGMALPFTPGAESLEEFRCGDLKVLAWNAQAGFDRATFPAFLAQTWQALPTEKTLYLFQAGWIEDKKQNWFTELRELGGDPRNFGRNVLVCPIRRTKTTDRIAPE